MIYQGQRTIANPKNIRKGKSENMLLFSKHHKGKKTSYRAREARQNKKLN